MKNKKKILISIFSTLAVVAVFLLIVLLKNTYSVSGNTMYLTDQAGKLGTGVDNIYLQAFLNLSNYETVAEDHSYKNVINYRDENGQLTDKVFMDSFLFMPANAFLPKDSNGNRPNFVYTFKKADISNYLDSEVSEMHIIDDFITDEINSRFGTRQKLNVFLTITLPQDSDCKSSRANAKTCLTDFIQASIDRFTGFTNLKLVGFYWLEEIVKPNYFTTENMIDFNSVVHSKGYKSFWIPYIDYYDYQTDSGPYVSDPNSTGRVIWGSYTDWQDYGFDFASLQTNYFFEGNNRTEGIFSDRLYHSHYAAEKFDMGTELELNQDGSWLKNENRKTYCQRYKDWANQAAYHKWDKTIKTYYIFKAFQYGEPGYQYQTNYIDDCQEQIRYLYDSVYYYSQRQLSDSSDGSGDGYINKLNPLLNCDKLNQIYVGTSDAANSINKITFNANGGTNGGYKYARCGSTSLYTSDDISTTTTAPTPTRDGYVFQGWYTEESDGEKVLNANGTIATAVAGYTKNNKWHTYYDKTLYAHWEANEANKVKVKYNINGGTLVPNHDATWSVSNGYITLDGNIYYSEFDAGTAIGSNGLLKYNTMTYADITRQGYHVQQGSEWYKEVNGARTYYNQLSSNINSDTLCDASNGSCEVSLYLNWIADSVPDYEVTYNCSENGGSGNSNATYEEGASVSLSKECTKSGWQHIGFNTNKDATSGLSSYTMPSSNTTLYAIYKKPAITLKANFNANGATLSNSESKTCTIEAVYNNNDNQGTSCTVNAPAITRTGYTVLGYNTSASSTSSSSSYNNGVLTLNVTSDTGNGRTWYAITIPNRYKVTFDVEDGTISGSSSVYVEYNSDKVYADSTTQTVATLPTASKTGYAFKGFAKTGGNEIVVNPDKSLENVSGYVAEGKWVITDDVTLYAKYKKISEVTYNCSENGGSGNSNATYEEGASVSLSKECTKSGWQHIGFNTNKDATSGLSSYTMPSSNTTLYAIYKKPAITLKANFNANGATLSNSESKTCTIEAVYNNNDNQGTSCTVNAPAITRTGYTVLGYNTSASSTSSSSSYNNGVLTLNVTSDTGNGRTWYAITIPNRYKVTFDVEDGTISGSSSVYVEYNSDKVYADSTTQTVATLPTASKTGYAFKGFAKTGGNEIVVNPDKSLENVSGYVAEGKWVITDDVTLYAKYKKLDDANGGSSQPVDPNENQHTNQPDNNNQGYQENDNQQPENNYQERDNDNQKYEDDSDQHQKDSNQNDNSNKNVDENPKTGTLLLTLLLSLGTASVALGGHYFKNFAKNNKESN